MISLPFQRQNVSHQVNDHPNVITLSAGGWIIFSSSKEGGRNNQANIAVSQISMGKKYKHGEKMCKYRN